MADLPEDAAPVHAGVGATASRRSARGERARAAILDAALEVAARRGLGNASLSCIAAQADTSKTSVLYHFGNLAGLQCAMAARLRRRLERVIAASAERGLDGVLDALFNPDQRTLLLALNEIFGSAARDPAIADEMRRGWELCEVRLVRATGLGAVAARSVLATIHGHLDLCLASRAEDPAPYRAAAGAACRALIRAYSS